MESVDAVGLIHQSGKCLHIAIYAMGVTRPDNNELHLAKMSSN